MSTLGILYTPITDMYTCYFIQVLDGTLTSEHIDRQAVLRGAGPPGAQLGPLNLISPCGSVAVAEVGA